MGFECSFFHTFSLAPVSSVSISIIVNDCNLTTLGFDVFQKRSVLSLLMGDVFRHKGGVEAQVVNIWPVTCKQMLEIGPRSPCKTTAVLQTA